MIVEVVLCGTWKNVQAERCVDSTAAARNVFDRLPVGCGLHDVGTARCGKDGAAGPAADYAVNLPP